MKNLMKATFLLAALLIAAFPVHAQTTLLVPTTFSAAVTSGSARIYIVASATNCIAGNIAYADNEMAVIESVASTTLTVQRGVDTVGVPHISGGPVICGPPGAFSPTSFARVDLNGNPDGSCTRGNLLYLPVINPRSGTISDCLGGQWQSGTPYNSGVLTSSRFRVYAPEPGAVAYSSINSTGTATIATEVYCTEVWVPVNKLLTGIGLLAGTANSTDKHYVILYDSGGTAIANSAVAGVTGNTTASAYQQYAFTSKFFAIGPAQYFACFQANGTTDTVRMATTGVNDNILTAGQTAATFGTIPALTVPTAFTTAVGPYVYLY